MSIKNAFARCQALQKNDKQEIKALKDDAELKESLKKFYRETIIKQSEDVRILFNWFIGSNFNVSLSDF